MQERRDADPGARIDEGPQRLDRRDFLRAGTVGSALLNRAVYGTLAAGGLLSAAKAAGGSGVQQATAGVPAFELEEATLAELQAKMAAGEESAGSLVEKYLSRIEALDRQRPPAAPGEKGTDLRHVIETNPEAPVLAAELDAERRSRGARGPLHGVPVLLKDNVDTADRMTTTAGSLALAGSIPARDSFVAARLRSAGAILLGKANLSEWANFRSNRSSSGWSGRGGQCRNPYALDRSPCGSSSGSAAAVAANLCPLAIGTETDGSIVCPSSANGIVGIKPTLGLVSRAGIIPIAHSQDTAGPMARTVADAAALLGALTGVDPRDEATRASQGRSEADYTRFLDPGGLRGARIGVARQFFGFHSGVDRLMEAALEAMTAGGAVLVDPVEIPNQQELGSHELEVLLYEFKHDLNLYLDGLGEREGPRTLEQLIRFNEEHRDEEMPYFEQERFEAAQEKGPLSEPGYRTALAKCRLLSRTAGLDAALDHDRLDAIVAPTGSPAWTVDLVNGDHFLGGSSRPAAVSGYPNITLPAGFVHGLPVGISFMGRAWSEPQLIRIAYAFEQASLHRRPPRFLPTVVAD